MLTAEHARRDKELVVRLIGHINETTQYEDLIPSEPRIVVNCREVTRINSMGVRGWIRFFQGVTSNGTEIVFEELSPPLVAQLNMIANFVSGATVESIMVPFCCEDCGLEFATSHRVAELKTLDLKGARPACPRCRKMDTRFDDVAEQYLTFLGD